MFRFSRLLMAESAKKNAIAKGSRRRGVRNHHESERRVIVWRVNGWTWLGEVIGEGVREITMDLREVNQIHQRPGEAARLRVGQDSMLRGAL